MLLRLVPFLLLVPAVADASLCNLEPATLTVPVNCPLVAHAQHGNSAPAVWVVRDGVRIDIDPVVINTIDEELWVSYSNVCEGETISEDRLERYDTYVLELPGVRVGDQLHVGSQWQSGTIVAEAQPCPKPYAPWCNYSEEVDCATANDDAGG